MSKGLEALNDLWYGKKTTETYQIIEKELKALEIIKEKRVDVDYLVCATSTVKTYNDYIQYQRHFLNQEEYDLLKEVLL